MKYAFPALSCENVHKINRLNRHQWASCLFRFPLFVNFDSLTSDKPRTRLWKREKKRDTQKLTSEGALLSSTPWTMSWLSETSRHCHGVPWIVGDPASSEEKNIWIWQNSSRPRSFWLVKRVRSLRPFLAFGQLLFQSRNRWPLFQRFSLEVEKIRH